MSISAVEITVPTAQSVKITHDTLSVELSDGRTLSVPLAWFPRLLHATRAVSYTHLTLPTILRV